ncbi:PREDICTED: actin-related protein 2/3 complex subunit 1A-like [Cyprinodon variegatus]|uniref:actin-related protein 2/3 complex subunit 1A-like n=1 Tax=Cyprinodon variegatus TaxID=28743 RepID=UPI00074283A2|nr:PREDICTED: actin-related protein 2/3 complex subunit 1A-like [Cyprinodon variegatus]
MSLHSFGLEPLSCHAWNKDRTRKSNSYQTQSFILLRWLSKHIKKAIRSTVLSLDWHPNNILLAAGSADLHCRVFSAYIKDIEDKPGPTAWGAKMPFGECLLEHKECGGWVHSVSFSPSGDQLAWVAHNSSITVADAAQGKEVTQLTTDLLPFLGVLFVNATEIVAAGHNCCPYQFSYKAPNTLEFVKKLDIPKQTSKGSLSAMQHFRNLDKKATEEDDNELQTLHQNSIMQLCVVSGERAKVEKYSSVGLDGALVIWDFKH